MTNLLFDAALPKEAKIKILYDLLALAYKEIDSQKRRVSMSDTSREEHYYEVRLVITQNELLSIQNQIIILQTEKK